MLLSMPQIRRFPDDEALLSLDFIVGFTIFMLAFIFVATMMSGLLVSLQSRTVDYDAVAYRTSVVLTEDPGEPYNWQLLDISIPQQRDSIKRLGLSIARETPDLLMEEKVNEFFNASSSAGCSLSSSFCYPTDYRTKLIFGDYPYQFNISLRKLNETTPFSSFKSVGEPFGTGFQNKYGYIKRAVKIKQPGAKMELDVGPSGSASNIMYISVQFSELYAQPNPLYRIDPLNEITNISLNNFTSQNVYLTAPPVILVYPSSGGLPTSLPVPLSSPTVVVYDKTGLPNTTFPCEIDNSSFLLVEDGFFRRIGLDEYSVIDIELTFNDSFCQGYPYNFNYATASLAPPEEGILEVRVW